MLIFIFVCIYIYTHRIHICMLAYIPYMDPMGIYICRSIKHVQPSMVQWSGRFKRSLEVFGAISLTHHGGGGCDDIVRGWARRKSFHEETDDQLCGQRVGFSTSLNFI